MAEWIKREFDVTMSVRSISAMLKTIRYDEWTDLTESMQELNSQIYQIIDFFDKRNEIK